MHGIQVIAGRFRTCLKSNGEYSVWSQLRIMADGDNEMSFIVLRHAGSKVESEVLTSPVLMRAWRKYTEIIGIAEFIDAAEA